MHFYNIQAIKTGIAISNGISKDREPRAFPKKSGENKNSG
jgi:hypothetical protein